MFLVFLKTLVAFVVFGLVYFIIETLLLKIEEEKEIHKEKKWKKIISLDGVFLVFEKDPKSAKARNIKIITAVSLIAIFFLWSSKILISLFIGIIGFFLPQFLANMRKERMAKMIDNQLADGLILIANSLKAGMSFPQTLDVMARQGTPPLSDEFIEVGRELKIGVSMDKSLFNMVSRWPSITNLRIAVVAINIAQEVGGNLSETLSRLSDTMRKRKEIQGKIDALTTQGKLSGVVTALTPFALFAAISWMSPDLMAPMINEPLGNIMLIAIVFLILVGFLVIRKIVDIDI